MEQKVKILVVDDDGVDPMAVRRALAKASVEIELSEVGDGDSAIAALRNQSYDCVFLHSRLPDQDSLTLIQKLHSLGIKCPIIILTNQGDEQIAVELMKAGAVDYLSKSRLSPEILAQVVRNAIRVYRSETQVALATQQLRQSNEILTRKNQELELQRQQIEWQNHQLREVSRLKSQFLATISHELRTPMNAIIGFSQLLLRPKSGELSHRQKDMLERVLKNSKHLLTLLNEILDFSQLEARRLEIKPAIFDLSKVVNATAVEMRSLAKGKNLCMRVQIELDNPMVFNDPTRIRQILINLLSNAIKFTESGGVGIDVRELPENRVLIAVCDTGIGIDPADIKHIFEVFRQVDQSTTRKYSGIGMGLPMVNALVQMMGGKITVESKLGDGAIVQVELPRQISSSIYQHRDDRATAPRDAKKKLWKQQETRHFPLQVISREMRSSKL